MGRAGRYVVAGVYLLVSVVPIGTALLIGMTFLGADPFRLSLSWPTDWGSLAFAVITLLCVGYGWGAHIRKNYPLAWFLIAVALLPSLLIALLAATHGL